MNSRHGAAHLYTLKVKEETNNVNSVELVRFCTLRIPKLG